ncbi:helix-turn-helix transcriptional regulator [Paenibacillus rhizoplanae]
MSFIHYVTHTKMEQAKEWLDQSPQSVEQVAEQLGYENKSYFTKLFKLHTGTTPGEFRGRKATGPHRHQAQGGTTHAEHQTDSYRTVRCHACPRIREPLTARSCCRA